LEDVMDLVHSAAERAHRRGVAIERAALVSAALLLALPVCRGIAQRWRIRHPRAEREPAIDRALEDTYPASDPPAPRYVDIPINRR
jgi:hypothetical protein